MLEHLGHFSSLEKKVQLLHDRRASTVIWNKEHFDVRFNNMKLKNEKHSQHEVLNFS